jgi:hypothetical protein
MVPGLEALMPIESSLIRVSSPVKDRLEQIQANRREDLGREVTMSEVLELLLADWAVQEYLQDGGGS